MNPSKQSKRIVTRDNESVIEHPRLALLEEEHWFYIRRRFQLSPRELQVAKLVCQGFNNEEIVRKLKIKHGTVKTHVRNIYRRIRVKNKIAMLLKFVGVAAKFSAKSGITPPIPIVDLKKQAKKAPTPSEIPQKK